MDADETTGVLRVGEVPVVIRRDSPVETDHAQAFRSGAEEAYKKTLAYVAAAEANTPPYTDMRPYADLSTFLLDRIQELG